MVPSMQLLQPPYTSTAYPWATPIITISINLACQVSPLEDTLVSTKRMMFHCKLEDTARGFHSTRPRLKSSTNLTVRDINLPTSLSPTCPNGEQFLIWMTSPSLVLWYLDYSEGTDASLDLQERTTAPHKEEIMWNT